ncbi:hypothetical protein [Kitasatospora sp. MBT63]|uniref:hypothetical protein n=1 Tax=Kitasatospora sp. MBT63 TaxID=1444768 RepID=UPI00053B77F3|nr:hypothetical protein [Kitasatospora sp. MBT63]
MDTTALETTRRSLHAVAELLLAGPQYRQSGTIRLRVHADGFATLAAPELLVQGTHLVAGGRRLPLDGTTCAALAAELGIEGGGPAGLYQDGSGVGMDEELSVDPTAAARLVGAFASGDAALRRFAPDQQPVLWPEHFDLGISVDSVNYGVSPGDGFSPEPYAYVGPWTRRVGGFWNASFGATRPIRRPDDAAEVLAFFTEGRDRAAADPVSAEDEG